MKETDSIVLCSSTTAPRHGKCRCDGAAGCLKTELKKVEQQGNSLCSSYSIFRWTEVKLSTPDTSTRANRDHVAEYHNLFYNAPGAPQPTTAERDYMKFILKLDNNDERIFPTVPLNTEPRFNFKPLVGIKKYHQFSTMEHGAIQNEETNLLVRRWPCFCSPGCRGEKGTFSDDACVHKVTLGEFFVYKMARTLQGEAEAGGEEEEGEGGEGGGGGGEGGEGGGGGGGRNGG